MSRLYPNGIVALLSDFGVADGFVGAVKGVMLSVNPRLQLVDISHSVPAQDINQGAYILASAAQYYPQGTVFWGVIDPCVGGERRAIAVQGEKFYYVGPDNGLFSLCWDNDPVVRSVSINAERWGLKDICSTFHGRDIFAPVAAHLASGVPISEIGEEIDDLVLWGLPQRERCVQGWRCQVLHTDGYGNLVVNWRQEDGEFAGVWAGYSLLQVASCYADVEPGAPFAYWGSAGYLEIGVNGGSAAERFANDLDKIIVVPFNSNERD